jgi:DNA topoisomerase-3
VLLVPGWKGVYGEEAEPSERPDDDTGGDQLLPKLEQGETVQTDHVESLRKETQPPRRFTDASLLGAMETAGKEIEDAELREAMKDSGIGTPATRAAIIERLINVGYIEREGRALVATEKGMQVIKLLGDHALTSPELTGEWEHRLGLIEQGEDSRPAFMKDIEKFAADTVQELDKLKGVRIERAKLGPCPVCGREIVENRKGFSCWSRDDPGCGFVIWKRKAGKSLPVPVAKELIESLRASRERGEDPAVGRTTKPVTGFRGRSGRNFRAKLRVEKAEDGKWRVEFDEDWARGGTPPPAEDEGSGDGAAETPTTADEAAADAAAETPEPEPVTSE